MDIDNLNLRIVLQVLAQLDDIHIHRAGIEVVIVNPDGLQGEVTLQDLVGMRAQQGKQFVLLGGQLGLLVTDNQQLLLGVEDELADMIDASAPILKPSRMSSFSVLAVRKMMGISALA